VGLASEGSRDRQTTVQRTEPTPKNRDEELLGVITPVVAAHGLAVFEVSLQRERSGWVLRVVVENPNSSEPGSGVTLDVCAEVSRDLSHALDVAEPITHAYSLEVASPGVERKLRSAEEFRRFQGQSAKVLLAKPAPDGQRALRGRIEAVEGDVVTMVVDGKPIDFPFSDVREGHLLFEFGAGSPKKATRGAHPGKAPGNAKRHAGKRDRATGTE
jgi:ribosome maturation factor RimP